jgi:recombination protein RecA
MAKQKEEAKKKLSLEELKKKHGDNLIEGTYVENTNERVPSGSLRIDAALGWHKDCPNGGWPIGTIVEIYGPYGSGKTTLASHALANAQRKFPTKKVAIIDMEHAYKLEYAIQCTGLNPENLFVSQPDCAEQALEIMRDLLNSEEFSLVVLDSVAGLVTRAELAGEVGDAQVAQKARLLSAELPKISDAVNSTDAIAMFINQERSLIGSFGYGPKTTTTGGNALPFWTHVRVDISRTGKVEGDESPIGSKTKIEVTKNKSAPPFKKVEFDIIFGQGIDEWGEILDLGIEFGLIEKKGAGYYAIPGDDGATARMQGRENAKAYLRDECKLLFNLIYDAYKAKIHPVKKDK